MLPIDRLFISFLQAGVDPNKFNDFMLLGYVVMWLVVMVYVLSLISRQRNVKEDLELMRKLLREDKEVENG